MKKEHKYSTSEAEPSLRKNYYLGRDSRLETRERGWKRAAFQGLQLENARGTDSVLYSASQSQPNQPAAKAKIGASSAPAHPSLEIRYKSVNYILTTTTASKGQQARSKHDQGCTSFTSIRILSSHFACDSWIYFNIEAANDKHAISTIYLSESTQSRKVPWSDKPLALLFQFTNFRKGLIARLLMINYNPVTIYYKNTRCGSSRNQSVEIGFFTRRFIFF